MPVKNIVIIFKAGAQNPAVDSMSWHLSCGSTVLYASPTPYAHVRACCAPALVFITELLWAYITVISEGKGVEKTVHIGNNVRR